MKVGILLTGTGRVTRLSDILPFGRSNEPFSSRITAFGHILSPTNIISVYFES